jgi:hypothetical protein
MKTSGMRLQRRNLKKKQRRSVQRCRIVFSSSSSTG